jgi:Rrf2 family transcriptional regulator, cysteine metabolism repressor
LKVSAKAEYACLALIDLAQRNTEEKPVHLWEIARAQGIPQSTLMQIMLKLKNAGLVRSARGAEGGYRLAQPPDEIKLGQVLKVIDGEDGVQRKLHGASAQVLTEVWDQIRELEREVLAQTSIAQLAVRVPSSDWVI